jgi:hypothetical protein
MSVVFRVVNDLEVDHANGDHDFFAYGYEPRCQTCRVEFTEVLRRLQKRDGAPLTSQALAEAIREELAKVRANG